MRRRTPRAALAAALFAATLVGLAAQRAPARPLAPPGSFLEVRVCTYSAFVLKSKRCSRDERARPLVSSRFGCSVRFVVRQPVVFHEEMTYEGERAVTLTTRLQPGTYGYWMSESAGSTFPLPGGRWTCLFTLGSARTSVAFSSGGPTGDVVDAAVCLLAHAPQQQNFRNCRADESGSPLAATEPLMCEGLFPKATGKSVTIQIVPPSGAPSGYTLRPSGPIWRGYVTLRPPAGGQLAAGDYKCRFLFDGTPVLDKPFQVGA